MPRSYLIYNFLGRANDLSDLIPSERFATIAAIIQSKGSSIAIWDGANLDTLLSYPRAIIEDVEKLEFYDQNVSPEYVALLKNEAEKILAASFEVVFLNLWRGPGFKFSIELAKSLKEKKPALHIFAIGQSVDRFKDYILNIAPHLDGVILGLGYESIEQMADGKNLEVIPNLILSKNGSTAATPQKIVDNINRLPKPIYDSSVYQGIAGTFPIFPLSLSNEACPFQCPFCMRPASYGIQVVAKEINNAVDELEYLMTRYGARYFRIVDSTPPHLALTKFSQRIIAKGLNKKGIHFSGFSRLDVGSSDDFSVLKEAGIEALFFGVETLDDNNQKRIRKVYPFETLKATLKRTHDAGIFTIGSLMCPLPGETKESIQNTLNRLRELKPYLDSVLIQPSGVYPSTEWGLCPEQYGIKLSPTYAKEAAVYPVKYILPIRFWKPFPFTYELMGKSADQVSFKDIVEIFEGFCGAVAKDISIPIGIQDYDLIGSLIMKQSPREFTESIVRAMVPADYSTLKKIFEQAQRAVNSIATSPLCTFQKSTCIRT